MARAHCAALVEELQPEGSYDFVAQIAIRYPGDLARLELKIMLEQWHRRIPHYRIEPGTSLTGRGTQLTLTSLPLRWETRAGSGETTVRSR